MWEEAEDDSEKLESVLQVLFGAYRDDWNVRVPLWYRGATTIWLLLCLNVLFEFGQNTAKLLLKVSWRLLELADAAAEEGEVVGDCLYWSWQNATKASIRTFLFQRIGHKVQRHAPLLHDCLQFLFSQALGEGQSKSAHRTCQVLRQRLWHLLRGKQRDEFPTNLLTVLGKSLLHIQAVRSLLWACDCDFTKSPACVWAYTQWVMLTRTILLDRVRAIACCSHCRAIILQVQHRLSNQLRQEHPGRISDTLLNISEQPKDSLTGH